MADTASIPEPATTGAGKNAPGTPWYRAPELLAPAALGLLLLAIYGPAGGHELIPFDDHLVVNQAAFNDCSAAGWEQALTQPVHVDYKPTAAASLLLEACIAGPRSKTGQIGLALTRIGNLLLHVLAGWLLWCVLLRLLPGRPRTALAVVVIMLLHPAAVECVVWLTGRNTLLAAVCALGSVLAWLRYRQGPVAAIADDDVRPIPLRHRLPWLALSLLLLLAGLGAKAWAVIVPGLIVLAEWTVLRGGFRRGVLSGIAPTVICIVWGIWSVLSVTRGQETAPLGEALLTHLPLLPRYLANLAVPDSLALFYTVPPGAPTDLLTAFLPGLAALLALWWLAGRTREATLALGWTLGPLLLVLGILPLQWWHMADRYLYCSLPGAALLAVLAFCGLVHRIACWLFHRIVTRATGQAADSSLRLIGLPPFVHHRFAKTGPVAVGFVAAILAGLSMQQAQTWSTLRALLLTSLTRQPDSAWANYAWADWLSTTSTEGDAQQRAARHFRAAIDAPDVRVTLRPEYRLKALVRLALYAVDSHDTAQAREWLIRADALAESSDSWHPLLPEAWERAGNSDRAAALYRGVFRRIAEVHHSVLRVTRETGYMPWRVGTADWFSAVAGDPVLATRFLEHWHGMARDFPRMAAERGWPEALPACWFACALYPADADILAATRNVLAAIGRAVRDARHEVVAIVTPPGVDGNALRAEALAAVRDDRARLADLDTCIQRLRRGFR